MGKGKDLTTAAKQKVKKGIEWGNVHFWDIKRILKMIKKAVENITKLTTWMQTKRLYELASSRWT